MEVAYNILVLDVIDKKPIFAAAKNYRYGAKTELS